MYCVDYICVKLCSGTSVYCVYYVCLELYTGTSVYCVLCGLQVSTLQEQLENGPSGQLTRLTQENSILRDALNQATSQAESRSF
jgi:hypothetical protein